MKFQRIIDGADAGPFSPQEDKARQCIDGPVIKIVVKGEKMIRVLVIECLLSALTGAIAFRLAWAFSKNWKIAWGLTILLALLAVFQFPGILDHWLVREFQKGVPPSLPMGPFTINALHSLCLLAGAGIASLVVSWRVRLGLDEEARYKDFP
jgi:hypothetical protein